MERRSSECERGVENPGYRKITKIYDENGVDWDYVNIDDKGI